MRKEPALFQPITQIPPVLQSQYLNSLDGLRALSISLVLLGHFVMSYKVYAGFSFAVADMGVQFFFVISGFLITTLLLKEKVSTGTIALRKFYIRRFLRIIPVAYLYLLVILAANVIFKLHVDYLSLAASFLFLRNIFIYANGVNNLATHYWSLSVEEQFYLLFPVLLRKSFRFYVLFLVSLIVLSVSSDPIAMLAATEGERGRVVVNLLGQFQSIALGSLCAISLLKHPWVLESKIRLNTQISAVLFAAIASLALVHSVLPHAVSLLQSTLFAAILVLNLQGEKSLIFRLLNSHWMKLAGTLSYSVYIWQQPFTLNLTFIKSMHFFAPFSSNMPVQLGISVLCLMLLGLVSWLSYFHYERRFLALKDKFEPRPGSQSPGHTDRPTADSTARAEGMIL